MNMFPPNQYNRQNILFEERARYQTTIMTRKIFPWIRNDIASIITTIKAYKITPLRRLSKRKRLSSVLLSIIILP